MADFEFDAHKNLLLQAERGISFEDIIVLIETGHLRGVKRHHNPQKYPRQHVLEVESGAYIYLVPCVMEEGKIFLKTIYPSRKATKRHKEKNHD